MKEKNTDILMRNKLFPRVIAILGFILIIALALYGYFPYILNSISQDTRDGVAKRILHTEYFTFPVISGNFEPTFYNGDFVVFTKKRQKRELKRGDLVFYEIPDCPNKKVPFNCYYFSRVVGLPGEEIILKERHIEVNRKSLTEKYAQWRRDQITALWGSEYELNKPILIPAGYYFLLDDDRTWSNTDSRLFGPISREKITGYYKFRLYRNYITKYPPPLFWQKS